MSISSHVVGHGDDMLDNLWAFVCMNDIGVIADGDVDATLMLNEVSQTLMNCKYFQV